MANQVRTLQAISDRAGQPDDLPTAGEFLDMKIDISPGGRVLSLRASKLLYLLIKHAGRSVTEEKKHVVPVAELNQTMHLTFPDFMETVEELMDVRLRLRVPSKAGGTEIWLERFLNSVRRTEKDTAQAVVTYQFSDAVRRVMEDSVHWGILSRKAVLAFESRYSLRLYEMMSLRVRLERNRQDFSIEEIRERFGVPVGKLNTWDALRRKAIEPAISEVNELSGYFVSYEPLKKGRAFSGIRLNWRTAPANERAQVLNELEASGPRTKRRRRAGGETVTEILPPVKSERVAFPREGGLAYSTWADIARQELPQPTPDLSLVADNFRDFLARKGVLTSNKNIEGIFRTFCNNYGGQGRQSHLDL